MNPSSRSLQRTALSVNVNKVALLRNTRHLGIPSVIRAAELCLKAGAQGITVHHRLIWGATARILWQLAHQVAR